MKRFLFVLLLAATVITAAGQVPVASAFDMCAAGQVHLAISYYAYPGGPNCGLTYIYCDGTPRYHDGCTTQTYSQTTFCECQ
jgi:hypothetical protein